MKIKENIAISDNGFLFNTSTGDSFTVNETGKEIIRLLNDGKSKEEVLTLLHNKYEIEHTFLVRYLEDFMHELIVHQLLEE